MSSDATLSGLEVADAAGNAIELDDDFAPDMFAYTATVANAIVRITVTPTADPADATYEIQGVSGTELMDADLDADGFQVDLVPGDNVVQVEVTGADDATTLTYTVTVARGTTVDLGAIPADWSLKPDAVAADGRFRLLFVSSTTRTADSTDIADYNAHVRTAAAAGHAAIQAFADDFTVVGSTLAVNARANTLTQAADTDAPIYWVDTSAARSAVADDYADFYDGTWDNPDGRTEAGAAISLVANPVATGSLTDGTAAAAALGGVNGFAAGWAVSDSGVTTQSLDSTAAHPLLGLSPVLRVAAPPDATLSDLGLKDNDGAGITLTPAFASVTTSYRATVANAVDEITVVPTPNDTAATVEIQDEGGTALVDADTGTDGFQVALRWGDNTIQVEVTATDGTTIGLYTVIVSRALARPSVSPTEGITTGLDVSWQPPGDTTIVISYDVQYREGDSGSFTDGPQDVTGTSTSIPGLKMNTSYQVQVRMTSAAGDSEWSPNGKGWTHAPEVTVASGWSLLPGGLATGAKFRLLFVSHDTRWNQSQIDSYNRWVQEYAATGRGHTAIRAYASGFRAVGCGKWVNARVNTGTQWSASDRGVPIHWLGGLTAADDYGDFYDGTWQNEDAPRTEAGAPKPASFNGQVFTGCTNAGDTSAGEALGVEFSERGQIARQQCWSSWWWSPAVQGQPSDLRTLAGLRGGRLQRRDGAAGGVDRAPDPVLVADERGQPDVARHVQRERGERGRGGLRGGRHDGVAGGGRGDGLDGVRRDRAGGRSGGPYRHGDAFVRERPGHRRHGRQRAVEHRADGRQPGQLCGGQHRTDGDDHGSGHEFGAVRGDVRLLRSGGRLRAGRHRGGQRNGLGLRGSGWGYSLFGADRAGGERRGDGGRGGECGHGRGGQRQPGGRAGDIGLHGHEQRTDIRRRREHGPRRGREHGLRPDVGMPVSADDPDDDPLTYTLEGPDAGSFGINRTTGRLRTSAALDHEAKPSHTLTVKADDERGGTATIVVTVNVDEKPAKPAAPTV